MRYLPAHLHNRPERIAPAVEALLEAPAAGGCSSPMPIAGPAAPRCRPRPPPAGQRLPGAHCYEVFAGTDRFAALHDEEPGTFFLTDFLARHFDALVWQGLGLDRHPELRDTYFGNYRRVVLLSQSDRR